MAVGEARQLGSALELLRRLQEAAIVVDDRATVLFSNDTVRELLGWDEGALRGQPLVTVIPERFRAAHTPAFERYVAGGVSRIMGRPIRLAALHRDGIEVPVELLLSPGPVSGTTLGLIRTVAAGIDLVGRGVLAEELLRVVADHRGDGSDPERLLRAIGASLGWDAAALWIAERRVRCLRCDAFWHRDGLGVEPYRAAACESLLPVGVGAAGQVWETGEPSWVVDIGSVSSDPVAAAAGAAGLRTSLAFPVTAGGSFVGVIELLDRDLRQPDADLLDALTATGRLVGEFLQRFWHEEERRRLLVRLETERARLEAVQQRMPSAMLLADAPSGRIVGGNAKLDAIIGPPVVQDVDGERVLEYRFAHPSGIEHTYDELPFARAAMHGESVEDVEYEFLGPDGSTRTVTVSAVPVHDREGRVVSAVATFHDVTEHRRNADRQRFLADASMAMARSLDVATSLAAVARLAVGVMGDSVGVYLEGPDGSTTPLVIAHANDIIAQRYQQVVVTASAHPEWMETFNRVLLSGRSVLFPPPRGTGTARLDANERPPATDVGVQSSMFVPLHAAGERVGVLCFLSFGPHLVYDESALTLAEDLARRAAAVITNGRLYQRERAVAAALQSSLLPPSLPSIPGLELAARFQPGGEGLEVGGDFYDVFPVGAATAVVIGDVCGKGADAAALTAQFRFTARALSEPGRDPGSVLHRVDARVQEAERGQIDRFCTAVYALLEPREGQVHCVMASAGHPLPLVLRVDGSVEEVDCVGSLLFVLAEPSHHSETITLRPGDALLLYTDGVTESRGSAGFFGEQRLHSVLASCAGEPAEVVADRVVEAAITHAGGVATDDIAVVVVVAR